MWHSHADNSFYGRVGWEYIHTKGVTERFGFDDVRTSQPQTVSQKQSNGNAPRVFYMYSPWCTLLYRKGKGELYTDIGVGLSALLVSTNWAMREPLNRGTSDRTGSTFFVCMDIIIMQKC